MDAQSAGSASNQTRSCHKFKDRQCARPWVTRDAARPARRGDQMSYAPALPPTLLGPGMALLG